MPQELTDLVGKETSTPDTHTGKRLHVIKAVDITDACNVGDKTGLLNYLEDLTGTVVQFEILNPGETSGMNTNYHLNNLKPNYLDHFASFLGISGDHLCNLARRYAPQS